jgi:hypothetical protein
MVVPLFVLAACAAPVPESPQPAAAHDMSSPHTPEALPASARMICSDDIKTKVQQALHLAAAPATHDGWADGVYTCHYALPMGGMTLSDRVFPDARAAADHLATQQAGDGRTQPLAGLGQQAYGSARGIAVVLKDNQVLTVDTTALPERFGANDQRRSDLAYEVASDVLGCWTGDE